MRCNSIGDPCFKTSRLARGFIGAGVGAALVAVTTPRGVCVPQRSLVSTVLASIGLVGVLVFLAVNPPQCDNVFRLPPEP